LLHLADVCIPPSHMQSSDSKTDWLHCTCRILPLALEKPAASSRNFIRWRGYVQQRRNDTWSSHVWSLDNPHASPNTQFQSCF